MLLFLSNPYVAFLLLIIGVLGLMTEFSAPGATVGGVIGAIALVLSFIGLFSLGANFAGLLLIGLAIVLFLIDIQASSHGVLIGGGIIAFILGSMLLFSSARSGLPWFVIVGAGLAMGLLFAGMVAVGIRTRFKRVTTGREGLIGQVGEARTPLRPDGQIFVWGSIWRAISVAGPISVGQRVRVERIDGLTLYVRPADTESVQPPTAMNVATRR